MIRQRLVLVICATLARTPTRRSFVSSARTAAAGIIAAVFDTSTERLFVNSVDSFFY